MRRFKLINGVGSEFDLMSHEAVLLSPSGLGLNRNVDSIQAGHEFIPVENNLKQQTVSGEIAFKGYNQYFDFVRFCSQTPLTLGYAPAGKWYYRSCVLETLGKGELTDGALRCSVDFLCLTPWYDTVLIRQSQKDDTASKSYNYVYPYTYAETSAGSVVIANSGAIEAPCRLHIRGPVINPSWALVQGGKVIATGKVFATIPEGHKLVVDSAPSSMQIAELTASNAFVQNLYQNSDFSTVRFLYAPVGESTVTFTHEGLGILDAFVEVKQLAVSV